MIAATLPFEFKTSGPESSNNIAIEIRHEIGGTQTAIGSLARAMISIETGTSPSPISSSISSTMPGNFARKASMLSASVTSPRISRVVADLRFGIPVGGYD
jgi:hypothetical protein